MVDIGIVFYKIGFYDSDFEEFEMTDEDLESLEAIEEMENSANYQEDDSDE